MIFTCKLKKKQLKCEYYSNHKLPMTVIILQSMQKKKKKETFNRFLLFKSMFFLNLTHSSTSSSHPLHPRKTDRCNRINASSMFYPY